MTPKERADIVVTRIFGKEPSHDADEALRFIEWHLTEAVREAQAAAIEQAAQMCDEAAKLCNLAGTHLCPDDYKAHHRADASTIRRLSPVSMELLRLRWQREEAKWWRYLAVMDEQGYFAVEGAKRLADLDARIKALEESRAPQ